MFVSILTRPEGRVLRYEHFHDDGGLMFQSSPDPKAGCYIPFQAAPTTLPSFNPHPTRRPGATISNNHGILTNKVSILTRPEGRVLPAILFPRLGYLFVSILTRPEGRVLQGHNQSMGRTPRVSILTRPEGRVLHSGGFGAKGLVLFQSSPDPKAGCYQIEDAGKYSPRGFNPHPTRRPGATRMSAMYIAGYAFQSSPDPKAGCYSE